MSLTTKTISTLSDLRSRLLSMVDDGYEVTTVVSVVLAGAATHELRAMAEEWLDAQAWTLRRARARAIERAESDEWPSPGRETEREEREALGVPPWHRTPQHIEAERRRLATYRASIARRTASLRFTEAFLSTEFSLGDGRRMAWGRATVEDHTARIEMMTAKAAGILADVSLHEDVRQMLITAGVACLNDLKVAA